MKATLARLVYRRVQHWRVEAQVRLRTFRALTDTPLPMAYAADSVNRAGRRLGFWLDLYEKLTTEEEF
jgi:hypothetical protein